ncbi:uncharacterized protein LOC132048009 [Lycium ferocissimum]|uniref:uncharacterized protein LOC132048009 n=1 Tax=Lycium ferocissimum TaxID=112874 RepID=UPI002815B36E|nr:uncharacterized protein LOC132048009 [Lycium ferocissimum]
MSLHELESVGQVYQWSDRPFVGDVNVVAGGASIFVLLIDSILVLHMTRIHQMSCSPLQLGLCYPLPLSYQQMIPPKVHHAAPALVPPSWAYIQDAPPNNFVYHALAVYNVYNILANNHIGFFAILLVLPQSPHQHN